MTRYRIVPRRRAEQDIDDPVDHYFADGGVDLALQFIDAIESAFDHLAVHPDSGSPRYAVELDLPNLRYWPVKKFPYLIFYVVNAGSVDIWRILHGKQDIPQTVQGELL